MNAKEIIVTSVNSVDKQQVQGILQIMLSKVMSTFLRNPIFWIIVVFIIVTIAVIAFKQLNDWGEGQMQYMAWAFFFYMIIFLGLLVVFFFISSAETMIKIKGMFGL